MSGIDLVGDRGQTNLRKKEHIHCDSRYGFSNYRRDRDDDDLINCFLNNEKEFLLKKELSVNMTPLLHLNEQEEAVAMVGLECFMWTNQ